MRRVLWVSLCISSLSLFLCCSSEARKARLKAVRLDILILVVLDYAIYYIGCEIHTLYLSVSIVLALQIAENMKNSGKAQEAFGKSSFSLPEESRTPNMRGMGGNMRDALRERE